MKKCSSNKCKPNNCSRNGKGDKNRTGSFSKYQNNYDKIKWQDANVAHTTPPALQ